MSLWNLVAVLLGAVIGTILAMIGISYIEDCRERGQRRPHPGNADRTLRGTRELMKEAMDVPEYPSWETVEGKMLILFRHYDSGPCEFRMMTYSSDHLKELGAVLLPDQRIAIQGEVFHYDIQNPVAVNDQTR
jgi:hypothetical protein